MNNLSDLTDEQLRDWEQELFDDGFWNSCDKQQSFEKFKNRSPLIIKIKVYDRVDNKQIREHIRNFRNSPSKDWLIDAIMWACSNGMRVEIERKE